MPLSHSVCFGDVVPTWDDIASPVSDRMWEVQMETTCRKRCRSRARGGFEDIWLRYGVNLGTRIVGQRLRGSVGQQLCACALQAVALVGDVRLDICWRWRVVIDRTRS